MPVLLSNDSFNPKIWGKPINLSDVLMGDEAVVKASIFNGFFKNEFTEDYNASEDYKEDKQEYIIQDYQGRFIYKISDASSKIIYGKFLYLYYKDEKAIILLYDVANKKTFESIKDYWVPEIKAHIEDEKSK